MILLGFGNVGRSLARLVDENDHYRDQGVELELAFVFDRGGGADARGKRADRLIAAKQERGTVAGGSAGTVEFLEALDKCPDGVLLDTSITDADSGEPGLTPVRQALSRGHSVVFASKGPLVAAFSELRELAQEHRAQLGVSAAVGIPLPSLEVGQWGVRGAKLTRFRGVLNDTTNQILRDLEKGLELTQAIAAARDAGIIEEDPRLDLDGWDAAYKLLILARVLWDPTISLSDVTTKGIGDIGLAEIEKARKKGRRIRLIATAERKGDSEAAMGIDLRVEPEELDEADPLFLLGPGEKGAVFETRFMGVLTIRSSKGGPETTAACAMKDVLNIVAPPLLGASPD